MSTYYRPSIQNGEIAKRPLRPHHTAPPVRTRKAPVADGPHQARALLYLIAFGACIAAGFVFSLHQHFTANAIERDDVRLKQNLDHAFSEQRHLELDRTRTFSPREVEAAAHRQGNLAPLKLDPATALHATKPAAVKSEDSQGTQAQPTNENTVVPVRAERRAEPQSSVAR